MARQARGDARQDPPDDAVLDAASRVISDVGLGGLTLDSIARAAGVSRMTLHRRGVTISSVVGALRLRAGTELVEALLVALSAPTPAAERLRAALAATLEVADRHLPVLAGLFATDDSVFHGPAGADGSLPTLDRFVAPFARLITDGSLDGSLRAVEDPHETATVLFNTAGWGYVHLRHTQGWGRERAATAVIDLVLGGLTR